MVSSKEGFTLSNTTLPIVGNSVAVIARYVDSSFLNPYQSHHGEPEYIETPEKNDINTYPNPTNSIVNIELPVNEVIKNVYIISSMGIYHQEKVSGNTVNLSKYPSGIYYIVIMTNKNSYNHKIIKL